MVSLGKIEGDQLVAMLLLTMAFNTLNSLTNDTTQASYTRIRDDRNAERSMDSADMDEASSTSMVPGVSAEGGLLAIAAILASRAAVGV